MPTSKTVHLEQLTRETAATIRATVRRWWLDPTDRHLFHVQAERTFVGARPVVVHLTVTLDTARLPRPVGEP